MEESLHKLAAPARVPQVKPATSDSTAMVTSLPGLSVESVRQYLSSLSGPALAELLIQSTMEIKRSKDNV